MSFPGVVHTDDRLYLYRADGFPKFAKGSPEMAAVERLTSMWTNFMRTGQPIPKDCELATIATWDEFDVKDQKYLDIGNDLVMKRMLHVDRMKLWDQLSACKLC